MAIPRATATPSTKTQIRPEILFIDFAMLQTGYQLENPPNSIALRQSPFLCCSKSNTVSNLFVHKYHLLAEWLLKGTVIYIGFGTSFLITFVTRL